MGFTTSGKSEVVGKRYDQRELVRTVEQTKAIGKFFTETDPDVITRYRTTDSKHYDDAIMRQAVEDVRNRYKEIFNQQRVRQ